MTIRNLWIYLLTSAQILKLKRKYTLLRLRDAYKSPAPFRSGFQDPRNKGTPSTGRPAVASAERKGAAMKETIRLAMRAVGRRIQKLPMVRIASLVLMVTITVGSVSTVMAATKEVRLTVNGKEISASAIAGCNSEEDARNLLKFLGYETEEDSQVLYSVDPATGNISIQVRTREEISVEADGKTRTVSLYWGQTVGDALRRLDVVLDGNDRVTPTQETPVEAGMKIQVSRYCAVTVEADGQTREMTVPEGTVLSALEAADITLGEEDFLNVEKTALLAEGMQISVSRVSYRTVTTEEAVAYDTVEKQDSSLYQGNRKVETQGQNGLREIVTKEKYVNGQLVESQEVSSTVVQEPVDEVVRVGTKQEASYSSYQAIDASGTVYDANGNPVSYTRMLSGRCASYTGGGYCSTGVPAAVGRVAVNPNIIPYGTKLFICSPDGKFVYGYAVAADTGGGCMQGIILCDLYMNTLEECRLFGSRTMNIYIVG